MGYACPVCETPQSDPVHLANHLGFTAVARGGDHEVWLDEHVPGWGDLDETALAERVVEYAEETTYPQVFEDTTDGASAAGHDHGHGGSHDGRGVREHGGPGRDERGDADPPVDVEEAAHLADADLDEDPEEILDRARELTRQRREESETE